MAETTPIASVTPILNRGYAHPEVLVSTEWVAERLTDPALRIIESDEDVLLYETGHIPSALKVDWVADLNDPLSRDYVDRDRLQQLLRARGISNGMTIVLYGDKNNWWATYAFWVFRLFGVENLRVMDGGRLRWAEEGRPFTTGVPKYPEGNITVKDRDDTKIRAFRHQAEEHVKAKRPLVDVRSPEEYRGERLHMPEYPNEGAQRGGHLPGAKSIPWGRAVNPDTHTFRPASELRTIYQQENGLNPSDETVVYCRIGERSSHTWFALTYLLGFESVRNYDGSWTEWGNLVRAAIEKP